VKVADSTTPAEVITPPGHRHPAQDPGAGTELHRLFPDPGHQEHVVVDTRLGGTGPRRPRRTAAEELVAHFAVPMAGGVLVTLVTLNTRLSPAEIAHIVETVRRYLRAGSVDTLLAGGVQVSVLDSFKPYLHDRLADGERNATRVARRDRRAGLHRRL
jgi:hypothetical protein